MSDPNPQALETLARAGRIALRNLWARRDERDELADPERALLAVMERHREYRPFWEGAEPEDADNPFLHVTLHQLIDKQVATDHPRGTRETFTRLVAEGLDPHEVEHRLIGLWAVEMGRCMKERVPFDEDAYERQLAALRGPNETT